MKKTLVIVAICLLPWGTTGLCAPPSPGPEIEIKGVKLGMPKNDAEYKLLGLTIGGVEAKDRVTRSYYEDKLDRFLFVFESKSFDDVLGAVKGKFPDLKCEDSTVTNSMGAKFNQVDCFLNDQQGTMLLSRFFGDVTESMLAVTSHRWQNEIKAKDQKKRGDI